MYKSLITPLYRSLTHGRQTLVSAVAMSTSSRYNFETLRVSFPSEFVYHVEINRPEKRNAMNSAFWREMVTCFNEIASDSDCRSIVVSGAGTMFSSGIDIKELAGTFVQVGGDLDVGRKALRLRQLIKTYQESFNVIEKCNKPVIVAIHGACIGGAVDMICACDIRYCSKDAWFQVKEVDVGLAADVGTLQRLPKIVGNDSLVRELCFTARQIKSDEALTFGLVSKVLPNKDAMLAEALEVAKQIAAKSPVAVQATKIALLYARDHSVSDGLDNIATLNQGLLQGEDTVKAATAMLTKEPAIFSKL